MEEEIIRYNTSYLNCINILINKYDLKTCYVNEKYVNTSYLSVNVNSQLDVSNDKIISENSVCILKNNTTNLILSFYHQGVTSHKNLSSHIFTIDNNEFRNIHIVLCKNTEELNEARQLCNANIYKRSFFASLDDICYKAIEIDKNSFDKIYPQYNFSSISKTKTDAGLHKVEIIENIPVGKGDTRFYKLTFSSDNAIDILPGQFIMVRTIKELNEKPDYSKPNIVSSFSEINPNISNDLKSKPISFLKRPFGLYRTYYENFSYDYISKLSFDKDLASIFYIIKPHKFEVLYKVLERGIGTNELTQLGKGDTIEILAPLGKVFDLRELVKEDIDEIHIVGGGVGIAPLVNIVQELKSYNFNVKAFIGTENYNSLIFNDNINGKGENVKIYIDDLKSFGLSDASDIYVSFLCSPGEDQIDDISNVFNGSFVTEPYADYLKNNNHRKILTFTCGPEPMMKKVHTITSQYNIKTYVLLEKRMGCGIGVCFSCVCKTIIKGEDNYSRVCIDGPIFESKQINWNE